MKVLPIVLACFSLTNPICDYKLGRLIESDRYCNISLCSEGKLFREDIEIIVKCDDSEIVVEPEVNIGYNPSIFVGNFLNNGLEQVLYSVESGGSGGYSFYELFSFKGKEGKTVFNSSDFSPTFDVSYIDNDIIKIEYQNKLLYLDSSFSACKGNEDCSLYVSDVNAIFPYYNIALDRYYLEVLQRIYGGYSANNFGYIVSYLEVNEDGYNIIDMGVISNFEA